MNCVVSPVIVNSNTICAVNITTQSMSLLLLMCTCHVISDLMMICIATSEIMSVYNIMNCSNFIIGGDMNTSFKRVSSNYTKHLYYICKHDFEGNNVCYTFTSSVDNCTHIIDHFLLNNGIFDHMLE